MKLLKAVSLSIGIVLLLVAGLMGLTSTQEAFLSTIISAGLVFGMPGLALVWAGWPHNEEADPASTWFEPEFQRPATSATPARPPLPPGWKPMTQGQPLPRPPAQPQVVYVPVYRETKERRKGSSPAAVGCLLLIIIGAVLLWPQIEAAFKQIQAERSGTYVGEGILEITGTREGVTAGTSNSFVIVTANVLPSAMTEQTARLLWRATLEERPNLHTFGAVLHDGRRTFLYGYDLTSRAWKMTDMTGKTEP